MTAPRVIGLIAGGRSFPLLAAEGVKRAGHRLVVAAFPGHSNMDVKRHADVFGKLRLGKLDDLIAFFKDNGVTEVIMAGTISKSRAMLDVMRFDARARRVIFSVMDKGDANLLKVIAAEFDAEGMTVIPAHTFQPDLLTPAGVLTATQPDEAQWEDLRRGFALCRELGRMDIGQCLVLKQGVVAAVEALEGTDDAVARGCRLGGPGCVVVKAFKPGQEERTDLPSAGARTIRAMARGKAACLGLEAGKSLLFEREEAIRRADAAGIAIVGLTEDI